MGFSAGFYLFHKFVNTEIAQPLGTILCVVTMTSFERLAIYSNDFRLSLSGSPNENSRLTASGTLRLQ